MDNLKNSKLMLATLVLFLSATSAYSYPPDNAAVLYYKATALYEIDDDMEDMLVDLQKGKIEANDKIREFVKKNRLVINTVLDATEVKNCDWGLDFSQGLAMDMPPLASIRNLSRLVIAEAKILAAEGDYDAAISRCMSIYKMARHVNDRIYISYLVATAIDDLANGCITQIMAEMSPNMKSLTQLKDQLVEIDSIPFSVKPAILAERDAMLAAMTLEQLPEVARLCTENESIKEKVLSLDKAAIDRNREYHKKHVARLIDAFDMPYMQGYTALRDLDKKLEADIKNDPDLILTELLEPAVHKVFSLSIRFKTRGNAIRAAVRLYLIKAQTGELPDELPAGLPKDLFSGKDFEYKKTAGGFILRCQGKDLGKGQNNEYEFKVKK